MLKRKKVKPITLRDVTIIDDGKLRKAITAASLGNAMEWFDFGVYGFVAYALGKVFFPGADPSVQMVAALATFSVPFLIRPLGGLFFGMLGDKYGRQKIDPGHLALTQIAQHLALLQKMDHRQHSAFPELPQQIAALYEWFSARCRWKEKALTQRGLLVQAGDQSEQIFTRWRAGAYNAWSLPGRCFIVLEELRWGAFGDACRLGSPQAVALLLGDLLEKATQHLAESINAAPTTRHYYHQWFASSTVPTGGEHADFLSWLGKWTTADKQPVCWSVTQRWQTVALGMPRLCSAQRLAGAMLEEIFSVNLA